MISVENALRLIEHTPRLRSVVEKVVVIGMSVESLDVIVKERGIMLNVI